MTKENMPKRHLGLPYFGPARRRSSKEKKASNVAAARRADAEQRVGRLRCLEQDCLETVGYLQLDTSRARPVLSVAILAPRVFEESSDPAVLARVRLTGSTDPETDARLIELTAWQPGARVEIRCRHDHWSRFGAGHLARRLRTVLG